MLTCVLLFVHRENMHDIQYFWGEYDQSKHRRTGPFPFGGGHNMFCPNFVSLPESGICLGNAFLSHIGGGGEECLEQENTTLLK